MINFTMRNKKVDSPQDRSKNLDLFNYDIQLYLLPSPKKMIFSFGSAVEYPSNFVVDVNGKFIPSKDIKMTQDLYHLEEPSWDINEFISKIKSWLLEHWKPYGLDNISVSTGSINDEKESVIESLNEFVPDGYRSQAYYIKISQKEIIISSWAMYGSYYAFLTLAQLVKIKNNKIYFPICEIWDYPDYEFRGLEDDISRGQRPTMENFKDTIQYLSRLKLNAYGLYIEDMYKFDKFPSIGKGRNPLTKEEIKELEDYAKEHFVELQPAVEMFGHMDNMLTLPEFRKYGEFPGAQCLDVSSSETRKFADDLLSELCGAFSSKMFSLVCDESFDFGLGKSKNYIKEKGKSEVLAEWYLYLVDIVKKHGKEIPGFAHDIIIHYTKTMELVKDKIPLIMFWSYSDAKKYKTISKLRQKGFEVVAVPTTFDWSRHYPYSDYAEKNTIYMGKDGLERGAKFLISTKFGDLFNENLRENIRYGIAIESQAAWNINSSAIWNENGELDCAPLKKSFAKFFFGVEDPRIIECMDMLNKQNDVLPKFPNGMFNRYWMDPYARKIKNKELKYQRRFVKESAYILKTLKDLRGDNKILTNTGHLDYLEFAARMALHFGVKILSAEAVWSSRFYLIEYPSEILDDLMKLNLIPKEDLSIHTIKKSKKTYPDLIPIFKWLSADIMDQKIVYENLWKRLAVEEGLEYPSHRFEVLNWYYERTIADLSENVKPSNTQLKSEWIWRNGKRLTYDWGNRKEYYFYTMIKPKSELKRAVLQGIVNNHMKIFLNGQEIGEVFSRFSLSQLPMAKSVQLFDITGKLKEDTPNILCVQAANWTHGIGGINILVHLEYENGKYENAHSNRFWRFTDKKPEDWPLQQDFLEKEEEKWTNARSLGRPPLAWNGPISAPNWEKNWRSEISFSFGVRNFIETSITSFVGEPLFKILFWLVPFGAKLLGTDMFGFRKL